MARLGASFGSAAGSVAPGACLLWDGSSVWTPVVLTDDGLHAVYWPCPRLTRGQGWDGQGKKDALLQPGVTWGSGCGLEALMALETSSDSNSIRDWEMFLVVPPPVVLAA